MACCNAGHQKLWFWQQPQRRYDLWCWKKWACFSRQPNNFNIAQCILSPNSDKKCCRNPSHCHCSKNILLENLFLAVLVTPNDTSLPSPGHLPVAVLQLCFVSSSPGCPTHQRQKGQSRAPDTYGTWHYIGILSEFIPTKGDATAGSGNRIDIISNIEQQFDTKSGFICAQILKSVQEETRETSNNPHFYQVWSGLIWNTCKIHLKTRSVTDPIVGGLRPLEKHPQMEYLVSQAQTTLKMVGIALGRSSEGLKLAAAK